MSGFIDGTYSKPDEIIIKSRSDDTIAQEKTVNPDYILWRRSDRLLRGWIVGTLSEEVLGLAVGLETSAKVSKALTEHFARSTDDREFYLTTKMNLHNRKNFKSINDYIRAFKEICDELNAIGRPIGEQQKVFGLLKGLGNSYESFYTTMLKPPVPAYNDVVQLLQSHENMKSLYTTEATNDHTAFLSQKFKNNNKYYKNNIKQGQTSFSSKGRGFTQAFQTQKPPESPKGKNNNQISQKANCNKEEISCQICGKPRHSAINCWHRFNQGFQPEDTAQALAAMKFSDNHYEAWFPDTGATQHMTPDDGNLSNLQPYKGKDKIMVGNGNKLDITHIGDTTIQSGKDNVKLKNVLVVPNIKKNLLSVSQLTTDLPYLFEFDSNGFMIKNRETGKVITTGTREGGLYSLEHDSKMSKVAFFSNRFRATSDCIWHQRLGHPHMNIVQFLEKNRLISINEYDKTRTICESCQLGKACRLPFIGIDDYCSDPTSKIHCDLCTRWIFSKI